MIRVPRLSRSGLAAASTCLVAALLTGCSGGNSDGAAEDVPAAPDPPSIAATTPSDTPAESTPEPAIEASALPVPTDGPKGLKEFPVPAGAEIVDLGPPLNNNWQFGIGSPDPATTVDFYKATLATEGYTLRENVQVQVGANKIEYDLAFFGPSYGVVTANDMTGGTLVTVDDEPITGLEP